MKKERPILFSTPMVEAILDGRKTMTRREIKIKHGFFITDEGTKHAWPIDENTENWAVCPYGEVGDILWVRESFKVLSTNNGIYYKADISSQQGLGGKWKPSIHMPRYACRILLKITKIRVQRLNDITERDAIREGIEMIRPSFYKNYLKDYDSSFYSAVHSFQSLWNKINGKRSWNKNPWVWVVSFKVIKK